VMESVDLPSEIKPPEKVRVPWGEFFKSMPVWAVTVAHFSFNWGYYTLLAWLPSYFELALGLEVDKSSFLTLIPYLAMTSMMPLVGPIADGMVERGVKLTLVRKICQGVAFVGPALCMVACGLLTPAAGAGPASGATTIALVTLLSFAFAFGAWSRGGLYCNHQDLSPRYAGRCLPGSGDVLARRQGLGSLVDRALMNRPSCPDCLTLPNHPLVPFSGALLGITNTAGALPGVLGVAAAGYLLDLTGSWALAVFFPTAICQLIGFTFYTLFASSERQSWS
jgi:ACS family sodium-dependent inorganic phosphate cotransporter